MNRAALALVVSCLVLGLAACPAEGPPCSAHDQVMAAHAVECRFRVAEECADVPDDECPAIKDCDEWGQKRCGLGPARAGAGGTLGAAGDGGTGGVSGAGGMR